MATNNDRVLPIAGGSKAKRLGWSTPPNQLTLPLLKLMREGNRTRRVYPENPYVETFQFRENLFGLLSPNLDGGTDIWSWLIVGPRRALLIGTAFGLGDLPALAARLAGGRPLLVVNSHAGRDQILGNGRFDAVYCHALDAEAIRHASRTNAWNSLFDNSGQPRWYSFDRKDLPQRSAHRVVPVEDGHIFDLGEGHEVELIWTAGYSAGHAMLLDRHTRCLFPGDDVSSDTIRCGMGASGVPGSGRYANLTTFRERLKIVMRRMDGFDYLFPAHGIVNLEKHLLNDLLAALDGAIEHPDRFNFISPQKSPSGEEVREKYVTGFSSIAYTLNGIRAS